MNDKFSIKIKIGDRSYPMDIDRKDEESYRKAAGQLNETISRYREKFQFQDSYDILAMAAFDVSVKNLGFNYNSEYSLFIDGLKNLRDDITDFLEEKK